MCRLVDLLGFLAMPKAEHVWLLLDVKRDDNPEELLSRTRQVIDSATLAICKKTGQVRQWEDRIVVGGWNVGAFSFLSFFLPSSFLSFYVYSRTPISKEKIGPTEESRTFPC